MADKPGIDDPISDQSTASTSGKSQGSHRQKKKPEAIQAEQQAKSSKDSNVSDKLDILIISVSNLKEDYKEFNSRLALLETQVEKKGPESSDDVLTQADEYSHEDFENEIEDSEEDANQFDSESFNDSFDAGVIADNVGPKIDRASRLGSTKDYCYHLIILASKRSCRRTRDQKTSNRCAAPNLTQRFKSRMWVNREEIAILVYCKSRLGAH